MQNTAQRPMGITILAVLAIVGGVLTLLAAIPLLGAGAAVSTVAGGLGGLVTIWTIVALAEGALSLAFGVGAWTLQPWAWTLGVVAYGISAILVIVSLFLFGFTPSLIINLAITGIILYYLFTPDVKRAFNKA